MLIILIVISPNAQNKNKMAFDFSRKDPPKISLT